MGFLQSRHISPYACHQMQVTVQIWLAKANSSHYMNDAEFVLFKNLFFRQFFGRVLGQTRYDVSHNERIIIPLMSFLNDGDANSKFGQTNAEFKNTFTAKQ